MTDQHDDHDLGELVRSLGIVQVDDPALHQPARRLHLPAETDYARHIVTILRHTLDQIAEVYNTNTGLGLAAPQVGIDGAAAIVRPHGRSEIVLLNAQIVEASVEETGLHETCLSLPDVQGLVLRPKVIDVEHQAPDGQLHLTRFHNTTARLVAHEVDHLWGVVYEERLVPGSGLVPVDEPPEADESRPSI